MAPTHGNNGIVTPPIVSIDLSLDPEDRYKILARSFKKEICGLTILFNALLCDLGLPKYYHGLVNLLARLLLRGMFSPVETAELRGISQVTGVPMYLLVAFNVVLDVLMGCTSGAVKTLEPGQPIRDVRMLHFRNLDWTMDPLRSIIVHLEFVRTKSTNPAKIWGRSVTYVGFVGMLTAVRERLSVSLNFRGLHNATSKRDQFKFYLHHLLVLLGSQPSISSILRNYIVPENANEPLKQLGEVAGQFVARHSTAAYIVFCDGHSTLVVEKDYDSGTIRSSSNFIAITNHDEAAEKGAAKECIAANSSAVRAGLEDLMSESRDRLECIASKWRARVHKTARQKKRESRISKSPAEALATVTSDEVIEWLSAYPTTNEMTHFGVVMDPTTGQVVWARVWPC